MSYKYTEMYEYIKIEITLAASTILMSQSKWLYQAMPNGNPVCGLHVFCKCYYNYPKLFMVDLVALWVKHEL